jgi:hypothetical protein
LLMNTPNEKGEVRVVRSNRLMGNSEPVLRATQGLHYFVNLVIFVPQVGQVARSMLRPLAVFSIVV